VNDYGTEKNRLLDFLNISGLKYDEKNKTWQCPNHADDNPSAVYYKTGKKSPFPVLWCPVCQESWSIFEVAGLIHNVSDFKDKLKIVRDALGIIGDEKPTVKKSKTKPKKEKKPLPFPDSDEDKEKINNKILSVAEEKEWGKTTGSWKYYTENEEVIALDVRFENEGSRKNIITFWYDGSLKWFGSPVFIYNRHLLEKTEKPILIHEGSKCADLGTENLTEFVNISWSGGSGKAHHAPWNFLQNHEVFILRDNDDPGLKAAEKIKEQLPQAKIIKPVTDGKGDDIEQFLNHLTPDELTAYILNHENIENVEPLDVATSEHPTDVIPLSSSSEAVTSNGLPFKILGIGDDGKAAFITEAGRLVNYTLDGLSKNKLLVLANKSFWKNDYDNTRGGVDWDEAIDDVIRLSQFKDHNEKNIRGRGAWCDGGVITYHDGVETYGEKNPEKIYLRLPKRDIGITDEPVKDEITAGVIEQVFKMSFETKADAIRSLGWAALAPFAGALPFRPTILITGPSGSGKTTIANVFIKKLADCEWINGSESTVAGIRGKIKYDSRSILLEESEKDTDKKEKNQADLLSLMRTSVSEDAPDTLKGTKDGGFTSFKMQNMFGFIAINPEVESIADQNRIFLVNMIKPYNNNDWKNIEKKITEYLNDKNCRGIRAKTWNNLKKIIEFSEKIVDIVRDETGKDFRSSLADSLLFSAFIIIWFNIYEFEEEKIKKLISEFYKLQQTDQHRDEAEEILDRIMDEQIEILHDGKREKLTIHECIYRLVTKEKPGDSYINETELSNYEQHLSRIGLRLLDGEFLAIQNNHHLIKRIIGHGTGYSKILKRHKGCIDNNRTVYYLDGQHKKSTVIKEIIKRYDDEGILSFD